MGTNMNIRPYHIAINKFMNKFSYSIVFVKTYSAYYVAPYLLIFTVIFCTMYVLRSKILSISLSAIHLGMVNLVIVINSREYRTSNIYSIVEFGAFLLNERVQFNWN